MELLDFVGPLLRPGVVLYWDDWKDPHDDHPGEWGEHLAWERWTAAHPEVKAETVEVNAMNQRIMVITEANGQRLSPPRPSMLDIRLQAYRLASTGAEALDPDYLRFVKWKSRIKSLLRVGRGES
jgi:hypothetical protein